MKNKGRNFLIAVGTLLLIGSLLVFLSNGIPSQLLNNTFWGIWFIIMGMTGIFRDYEHVMLNKNFYMTLLGLNLYILAITAYIYLFEPAFTDDPYFYLFVLFLVFLTSAVIFGYKKLREYQKAVETYEKALKVNSSDISALNNKGIVFAEFKAYPQAIECFDMALIIDPENVQALYNEGNVLVKMEIYQTAAEYYEKALKIDPNNIDIWNNRGNALTKLKKYHEAIDCYNAALELDSSDASIWYNKGNALQELGKCDEALECYNKVLELYPNFEFNERVKKVLKINR